MRSCKSLQLWLAVSFGCRVGDCLSGAMVRSTIRVAEMSVDVFEGSRPPSLEADDGELSSVTWAGSRGLAEYIAERSELVRDRRVLELGCGTGLVSLTAAKLGAQRVVSTDGDDRALSAVACAAEAQGLLGVVETATLDVRDARGVPARLAEGFDLVVAADCCYTSELALALAHASCAALRSGCALCVADSQGWNSGKYRDALLELLGESVGRTFAVPPYERRFVVRQASGDRLVRKLVRILRVTPIDQDASAEKPRAPGVVDPLGPVLKTQVQAQAEQFQEEK